jgi:hypothetical protein
VLKSSTRMEAVLALTIPVPLPGTAISSAGCGPYKH